MSHLTRHKYNPDTLRANQRWAAWEAQCCRDRKVPGEQQHSWQRDHAERYARARRDYAIAYGLDTDPEVEA